jgi:hypothetical protein
MRFVLRAAFLTLLMTQAASLGFAQAAKPAPRPAAPWKRYCQPTGGFCFKYPSSWKMLGDIYDGRGVVVAPQQAGDQNFWDEVTVAMVAPPPEENEGALSLDGVIQEAAKGMSEAGQNFQTLQRQQRTVDAKPAELLKTQYIEKTSGRSWIEELVFIQGPDDEIYSVALKCAPKTMAKLEPIFTEILRTWTLPEAEPPAVEEEKPPAAPAPQH